MRRRIWIAVLVVAALALAGRIAIVTQDLPQTVTAAHFERLRTKDLPRLRDFLHHMPKGGDLHTHLSGAVYAERFIAWAVADGLCLRKADLSIQPRPQGAPAELPCGTDPALVPIAEAAAPGRGQNTYDLLVNSLSMRWFLATPAIPSGHDQFFSTFGRFNAATGGTDWATTFGRTAEMTVDQLRQYDATGVQYAELMVTLFEGDDRRRLAQVIAPETGPGPAQVGDPAAMLAALERAGLSQLVAKRTQQLKELMARIEALLDCDAQRTRPGCGVTFRYIAQVNRNSPPAEVFAQTAFSVALVRAAPGIVVGINYVGPEDYQISRRDYRTHMKWIGALAGKDVPVALHAGELWLGLVPPEDLDFHIRDAVETAGARRIGHGTAIAFETDMNGLLEEMRRRNVTVEIALTSSDVILGIRGKEHPIITYLRAGVPLVLATDDAGVSRIDLGNEYFRAARDHAFDYRHLKMFAHNAISQSFLAEADKTPEMEKLDRAYARFERSVYEAQPFTRKAVAVLRALAPSLPAWN